MTPRDKNELARLVAELTADLASLGERAAMLGKWTGAVASEDEVLIPAALLHHFYTGIESALARLANVLEGSEPGGPDSHARLLSLSALDVPGVRPAWLTAEQAEDLRELLGFRHFFRHGYAAKYRPERVRELVGLAVRVWPGVQKSLERARDVVEQLATAS